MRFKDWFEVAKVRARKNDDTVSVGTISYNKSLIYDLFEEDFRDCYMAGRDYLKDKDIERIQRENINLKEDLNDLKDRIMERDY